MGLGGRVILRINIGPTRKLLYATESLFKINVGPNRRQLCATKSYSISIYALSVDCYALQSHIQYQYTPNRETAIRNKVIFNISVGPTRRLEYDAGS